MLFDTSSLVLLKVLNSGGTGKVPPFLKSPAPEPPKPEVSGDSGGTGPGSGKEPGSHFPVRFIKKKNRVFKPGFLQMFIICVGLSSPRSRLVPGQIFPLPDRIPPSPRFPTRRRPFLPRSRRYRHFPVSFPT